ncbi:LOW QUALITY PROTEIN: peroxidase 9 [Amborella trichopoda]|uniref:LOW QUALITY PROTEIN: peroxidase 9 n=1 Tax=Amborella trichopoda TaxID=13333 RepID=UPI0009BE4FAF|nr:LOW QUALITY PROTEIN: peroxidase 9 [Amborella trichopoda]|eukprot:XP_006840849.2 LOW QUALITY PROTEIN: peroxidase 9 [Amborella trichopoda]
MDGFKASLCLLMVSLSFSLSLAFFPDYYYWGDGDGSRSNVNYSYNYHGLSPYFYDYTCPQANEVVIRVLENAFAQDPRLPASLLRLHFHDCFVQGCDGSLLLDNSESVASEKKSGPNLNSVRGFEVVDLVKAELEAVCPGVVSCADLLALAARASSVLSGGPSWEVAVGRRDSRTASLSLSDANVPAPNSTFQTLLQQFSKQGLDEVDLVALSGSHTLGMARCVTFRQRLYNQNGNGQPDASLEGDFYNRLTSCCPSSGGDNNLSPLDMVSPTKFDNYYYKLLLWGKSLLNSDMVLVTEGGKTMNLVQSYAENEDLFFDQFAKSMVKMGNLNPLLGSQGEVRTNCRLAN